MRKICCESVSFGKERRNIRTRFSIRKRDSFHAKRERKIVFDGKRVRYVWSVLRRREGRKGPRRAWVKKRRVDDWRMSSW